MTLQSPGSKLALSHKHDWLVLLLLAAMEGVLNLIEPFHRYIGKDMMTDLMFPFKEDTIPMWAVPIYSIFIPILIFVGFYFVRRDIYDLHHAILGIMFASLITGVITDSIKDAVGRPRPNFFQRCFPDKIPVFDKDTGDVLCTGIKAVIKEGYKSFPSGHTSWSFAGLGFLSWYLSGKIRVFDRRGHIAKLCLVLLPLLIAALVGVTRVDDYWHHWTDVFAGGLIGLTVSSICYLLLFPFPTFAHGWAPHAFFHMMEEAHYSSRRGSQTPQAVRNDLISIIDLNLVPWGNARLRGNDTFDCQHGPYECLLNTVEGCAIHIWPELSEHFPFIYCVEDLVYQGRYKEWESCFEKLGLDSKPIDHCYRGEYGKELELQYAAETNALQPPHKYVPWVVVDGEPLYEDYGNFLSYVCKAYQGPDVPKSCNQASYISTVQEVEAKPKHSVCVMERVMSTWEKIRSTITSWMYQMNLGGAI